VPLTGGGAAIILTAEALRNCQNIEQIDRTVRRATLAVAGEVEIGQPAITREFTARDGISVMTAIPKL